jgi:hypothetical protein
MEYNNNICGSHHNQLDGSKKYNQTYNKKDDAQRKRATARAIKIRKDMRKVIEDKKDGKSYWKRYWSSKRRRRRKRKGLLYNVNIA